MDRSPKQLVVLFLAACLAAFPVPAEASGNGGTRGGTRPVRILFFCAPRGETAPCS